MLFIKDWHFKKYIYPHFYANIELAEEKKEAVLYYQLNDNSFLIMVIINKKAIIFNKKLGDTNFFHKVSFNNNPNSVEKQFYDIIKATKNNATTIKNHSFIESFAELMNRVNITYKLPLKEQHNIWNCILTIDPNFCKQENTIFIPQNSTQKWVD